MKTLRNLFFKPKERVIATIYTPDEYKNGVVIEKAHYIEKDVKILHWGIAYEEISGSFAHFSVIFVRFQDGTINWVYPTNIRYEYENT